MNTNFEIILNFFFGKFFQKIHLEGQHVGVVVKAFLNFIPPSTMRRRVFSITSSDFIKISLI